jgi:hypothetical protein
MTELRGLAHGEPARPGILQGLFHTNREATQLDTGERRPLRSGVTARQAARPRGGHMAETMAVGVDVDGTFTDLVAIDRRETDELRRRGRR